MESYDWDWEDDEDIPDYGEDTLIFLRKLTKQKS